MYRLQTLVWDIFNPNVQRERTGTNHTKHEHQTGDTDTLLYTHTFFLENRVFDKMPHPPVAISAKEDTKHEQQTCDTDFALYTNAFVIEYHALGLYATPRRD